MKCLKLNNSCILILAVIILATIACGCRDRVDNNYEKYLIHGMTEKVYMRTIENILVDIYEASDINQKDHLREVASEYMTQDVVVALIPDRRGNNIKIAKGKCEIQRGDFAYGEHQKDGLDRAIIHMKITTKYTVKYITMELRINKDDMIYEEVVW